MISFTLRFPKQQATNFTRSITMQDQIPTDPSSAELLKQLSPLVIAILGATARFLMQPRGQSAWTFLRGLVMAALVAVVVDSLSAGSGINDDYRVALIGISAFLADDLLRGLISLGEKIRNDPFAIFDRYFGGKK